MLQSEAPVIAHFTDTNSPFVEESEQCTIKVQVGFINLIIFRYYIALYYMHTAARPSKL